MADPPYTPDPHGPYAGSVTDHVFHTLYEAVISGELPPGTKVSEYELASRFDVSRQPVRDAFFRLSKLGFLTIRPQRPTLISHISPDAIHNAVFTRIALELACLRAAFTHNRDNLITDLQANVQMQRTALASETSDFHTIDEAFHEHICAASGQLHIWPLIKEQKGHLDRLRLLTLSHERRQFVIAEHDSILAAVVDENERTAETLLADHISAIKSILPDAIARYPDHFGR